MDGNGGQVNGANNQADVAAAGFVEAEGNEYQRLIISQNFNAVQSLKLQSENVFHNVFRRPTDIAKQNRPDTLEEDYNFTCSIAKKVCTAKAIAEAIQPHIPVEHQAAMDAILAETSEAVRLCEVRRAATEAGSKVAAYHLEVRNVYYNNRSSLALNPSPDVLSGITRLYDIDSSILKEVCKEVKVKKGVNPMSEVALPSGGSGGDHDGLAWKRVANRSGGNQWQQPSRSYTMAPPLPSPQPPPPIYHQGYHQPPARGYGQRPNRGPRQQGGH